MLRSSVGEYHSLPNVRGPAAGDSVTQRLHSTSLLQIKRQSFADYEHKPSPFNMRWINGYNPKVGVINLNRKGSTTLFYAAVNCGVLYNWSTHEMRLLQGHKHMVTSIAADGQGKWLVTADYGPENIITIWESSQQIPRKTLFNPHGLGKISKVCISCDAKYLLSLGYQDKATLYWWIWSMGWDNPHATLQVDIPQNGIVEMSFNPENSTQFVLMTKQDIWIGISAKIFVMERGLWKETEDWELKVRRVERSGADTDFGSLTSFTFVAFTSQILVGTSRGVILIYGYTIDYRENVEEVNYENLRFVKGLKLEKVKITVIKSIDGVIVTGNKVGEIRLYDERLLLLYWVQGFRVDSVHGLSFNLSPRAYELVDPSCNMKCPCWEEVVTEHDPITGQRIQKLLKKSLPTDATVQNRPFLIRDFIISTHNQGIGFVDFVLEKVNPILKNKPSPATALTVHPDKDLVCIGFASGMVDLFNFVQHKVCERLDLRDAYKLVVEPKPDSINSAYFVTLPQLSVSCLRYSPSGLHLACGLNTGKLIFLEPITIQIIPESTAHDTRHSIKDIVYSADSLTLAFADTGRTVGVYKYNCEHMRWTFIGKHRAHYKNISAILFTPAKNEDGFFKLISIGHDRIMVEYDIGKSKDEALEMYSLDRIEQAAVPLTATNWVSSEGLELDPNIHNTDLPLILIANDEYKYKLVNYETTMTLSTVLGPRFEQPVCRVQRVTRRARLPDAPDSPEATAHYLLFATKNVIGLQKMPLDGNPWKHVALLGHPTEILEMCFREDLGILFTIGAKDPCMIQWAANYRAVDMTSKKGGEDLDPYYCLIEDGRPGWLFQEIRDLFYYIQILCQGTFSPAMRTVKDFIPIDSLPDLMRALGYFPSQYEAENLLVEAKYCVHRKQPRSELEFEDFVKLYVNHRPALGDSYNKIRNAFRNFATFDKERYYIPRDDFIEMLANYGECFPRDLSWYLLSILSGLSFEDRANLSEDDFSFLPENIEFNEFLSSIIGVPDMENLSEQRSMIDSTGSLQHTCSSATQSDNE